MLLEILRRVSAHERELERGARLADDRRPDQLMLEEEADECGVAVECAEEREDVDPRDVVADDQVMAVVAYVADAVDAPLRGQHQDEERVVAAPPPLREPRQREDD